MPFTCHPRRALGAATAMFAALAALAAPARAEAPQLLARAAADTPTAIDVYFPPQHLAALEALTEAQVHPGAPEYHHWLTPRQFAARFGAPAQTVAAVTAELRAAGFTVAGHSALGLHLTGTIGTVERTFGVAISHARFSDGSEALVAPRPLRLPASLVAAGAHVPQFLPVPPFHRDSTVLPAGSVHADNRSSAVGPYYPRDLRQAYDYPSAQSLNGTGVTIGILMTGDFNPPDMAKFWKDEQVSTLTPTLVPKVSTVQIGGGAQYNPNNSGETHLDIQQSGGMALGATVKLYNLADLSDGQILAGLTQIIEDNTAEVVNMSFGASEADYTESDSTWVLDIGHQVFLQGNAQGITFVASSGDNGADPFDLNGQAKVSPQYPAEDPNVTAVGGTNLVTQHSSGSNASGYVRENAQFDLLTGQGNNGPRWGSGGGISSHFAKPSYQTLVTTPSAKFRTIPDLALHMGGCTAGFTGFVTPCPADRSTDNEAIGGAEVQVIGTSAAAPDITGLFALKAKLTKGHRLGNVNPYIYQQAQAQAQGKVTAFRHKAIPGSNGAYTIKSTVPYDPVIGNGTIIGRAFLGATNLPTAGIPGTAANP